MYYDEFLQRLKKNSLPGYLLFYGESDSVITDGWQTCKSIFQKEFPEGTLQVFDGNESSLEMVLSIAQTSSLFSTSQMLLVKHAEKLLGGHSEAALALLTGYFKNPNPSSYLVFLAQGMRKGVKAITASEKMGWAVQCSDIPEWKLTSWLRQQAQNSGLAIGEESAQILIQKVGNNIGYLQKSIEQLALYIYPQKTIQTETVRNLPVPGLESGLFPLLDAIGLRKPEKALQLVARLEDGINPGTLIPIYGRMRELLQIAILQLKGTTQSQAAQILGLHPFRLKNLWEQASQYNVADLKGSMMDLIHLQAGMVTGRLGKGLPPIVLDRWILKWGKTRMASKGAIR